MKYTPEITKQLLEQFASGVPVCDLASQFGTNERSIRAKLSAEGVYKRKEYVNKLGEIPIAKAEYIEKIAEKLSVPAETLESLEKANKRVLKLIFDQLK